MRNQATGHESTKARWGAFEKAPQTPENLNRSTKWQQTCFEKQLKSTRKNTEAPMKSAQTVKEVQRVQKACKTRNETAN